MIDPSLFENLIAEIENHYGQLSNDESSSQEYFQSCNQKKPDGEKLMRRKLFELVRDIPHFRDLIQISSKNDKFEQLCKKMTFRKYSKGDILFKQSQVAREMILVVEGRISMWQLKSDPDINNEQKLIQATERSMKAYKREEAKSELEKIRNLEEDQIFHTVAMRNTIRQLSMQKSRKINKSNTQSSLNQDAPQQITIQNNSKPSHFGIQVNNVHNDQSISINKPTNLNDEQTNGSNEQKTKNNEQTNTSIANEKIADFTENQSTMITAEENRYFKTDNICKYKRAYYHQRGDFLGEKEALSNERIEYLGIAHTDRVLAFSIPTDSFLSMFDLESAKTEFIVKSLQKQFPSAHPSSLLRIAYDFKSQSYDYNQPIFHLRDKADRIFIVKSGLVEVGQANLIKLALLAEGQLLGFEDCISEEKQRNFWATSKSGETLLFYINSALFLEIVDKTYDGKLKRALIENTNKKLNYYSESTSKIQDIFTKVAPKKKHTNENHPILQLMVSSTKAQTCQKNNNNTFLDNTFKTSKYDSANNRKEVNSSKEEIIPQITHTPFVMTQKFKSMNNIKGEVSLDETTQSYLPSSRKTSDNAKSFSPSPQLRTVQDANREHDKPLTLPNINMYPNSNPQKRVQIMLDCFDPQYQKPSTRVNADRMSERKVKSLANISDDSDQPMTERDRQLQNIEKRSNKNLLKTIDRALEYKREIVSKRSKPLPTEKEDAFMKAFKFQKARFNSVFTSKKPGLPFRNTQNLQQNLTKYTNDNLICRKSEPNLQDYEDDNYDDNDLEVTRYPQSSIYYNGLDESYQACPQSVPIQKHKQNDRPSSLQHIDFDFESQNHSTNNIHIKSLNKLSPIKSHNKQRKNNLVNVDMNSIQIQKKNNQHIHSRSTPFIKNIFLSDTKKTNNGNSDNDTATHTTSPLPKIIPFLSHKKVNDSTHSYLDITTSSIHTNTKNNLTKKQVKLLDFEGIFEPQTKNHPFSTSNTNNNGLTSLGITLNQSSRNQKVNDYSNNNLSIDRTKIISPIKQK